MRLLDSFHIRCLRSIAGIPSTWGATLLGIERISHEQVRCQMNLLNLSDELQLQQMSLLGHILRRPPNHPARVVTFNRFLQPQMLVGPFMREARRIKWNDVVQLATTLLTTITSKAGVEKYILQKLFEVAQTEKNGPHFCKLSAFLGAAHGMLLVLHGNENTVHMHMHCSKIGLKMFK